MAQNQQLGREAGCKGSQAARQIRHDEAKSRYSINPRYGYTVPRSIFAHKIK